MNHFKDSRHWFALAAWLLWAASGAVLAFAPDISSIAVLIFLAVVVLGLAVVSSMVLAILYRRYLASWPGIISLAVIFGLAARWAGGDAPLSGFFTLLQLSVLCVYPISVAAFIYKRDVSAALLGALLLTGVWLMAAGVGQYRGAADFLLAFASSLERGGFEWLSAWAMAFYCALPPIAVGFWAHLARLVWREWKRK